MHKKRKLPSVNLLEGNEITLLSHVNSLQSTIEPRLDLSQCGLFIISSILVLSDQNFTSIPKEDTTAAQLLDVADRLLNLELVLTCVELLVDSVLDKEVQ